jgi:hypothetical protein
MLNQSNKSVNISEDVLTGLRNKYSHIHPLLFLRSVERAKSAADLFDILDTMPEIPVVWNETERRWTRTDLSLSNV